MFCLIISTEKISAQWTLETQKSSTEMEKNSIFQKCPKTFPRLSKHVLMWFFRDFLASATWRVEKSKNFKEMQKLPKIQDTQIRFQKYPNKFWTCFEVFSRKKSAQCTLEGRNLEKLKKNWKTLVFFSKSPKSFPKVFKHVFNMLRGSFFGKKKFTSSPWRVETCKKHKKVERLRNFQSSPKTFPKTLFEHVLLDYFDGKKLHPVNPGDSKNPQESKRLQKFKIPKNVIKSVQTCLR